MSPIDETQLRLLLADDPLAPAHPTAAAHTAARAVAIGRQRKRRRAVGSVAASGVLVLGLALGAATWAGRVEAGPLIPGPAATGTSGSAATTAPATTESAGPTTSAAPSASPAPTVSADPSGFNTTAPYPSTGPTSAPVRGVLPAGVRLAHEGVRSSDSDVSDWSATPWRLDLCSRDDEHFPRLGSAEIVRAIERTGTEIRDVEGILVFADSGTAAAFVADLRATAAGCPSNASPAPRTVTTSIAGAWEEGFAVGVSVLLESSPGQVLGEYGTTVLGVARVGRVVTTSEFHGEFAGGFPDGLTVDQVDQVRAPLDVIAPSLCRLTATGC